MWYYKALSLAYILASVANKALEGASISSLLDTLTKLFTVRSLVAVLKTVSELDIIFVFGLLSRVLA